MDKIAYIKQIGKGKWRVFSEKGRNMGTFDSKEKAKKRLRQIEFFKHRKASKAEYIDLDACDFTYSSIARYLRNNDETDALDDFRKIFLDKFNHNYTAGETENLEKLSLIETIGELSKDYDIKFSGEE